MDDLLAQLDQLHQALQSADDESKPGIQQLINDIQELLRVVPDSATPAQAQASELESTRSAPGTGTDEDDEFLKFQAEIAALDAPSHDSSNFNSESSSKTDSAIPMPTSNKNGDVEGDVNAETHDIVEELKALEGMKCLSPFQANWGQIGYYSGIILCVDSHSNEVHHKESSGDIRVRIVFTQPIVERMRPCEFFMEGRCRFPDNECKFSHGEVVSLSELREYQDPDYSKVIPGAEVLAKYSDGLWYKATVRKITESGECELFYQSHKDQIFTIPIHETCPVAESDDETDDSSDDESREKDSLSDEESNGANDDDEITPVVFIRVSAASPLGEWEKHTRGIGSKLMAKMGYILGTGLGKNAEGRVNPVDAVVLPPGRSLDRCMELKEKAGTSGVNLFSVERRLKRQKQKEAQRAQIAEKKQAESESVFNFLNSSLNLRKTKKHAKNHGKNAALSFNKESCKDLSKNLLTVGANIKLVEKDISKCKESIKRHEGRDKATVDKLKEKLNVLEYHLSQFRNNETQIAKEQSNRNAKKKLEIF